MTLSDLRTLLTLARGPAVEWLRASVHALDSQPVDLLADDIAAALLPSSIRTLEPVSKRPSDTRFACLLRWSGAERFTLDTTDPGTVHALRCALALALGLDPSEGALWIRVNGDGGWRLLTGDGQADFDLFASARPPRVVNAPEVFAEQDPIKALVLACEHVVRGAADIEETTAPEPAPEPEPEPEPEPAPAPAPRTCAGFAACKHCGLIVTGIDGACRGCGRHPFRP